MSKELYQEISSYIDTKLDFITETRQDLHRYAERGWCEIRTCSIIADHLTKMGYENILMGKEVLDADARMGLPTQDELDLAYRRALEQGAVPAYADRFKDGFTGIVAILDTGRPGPVIGFRVDIDALGVMECRDPEIHRPAREGFASVNDGEMHACGHDAHAAIGMALADVLIKYQDELCGTIKLIFQPAEEGVRGALALAESGVLDDIGFLIGVHMWDRKKGPGYQLGFSYFRSMANAKLDVELYGEPAHAAQPENGRNAMLAAANIINGIYGIPRPALGDSKINIGTIQGGTGRNVICDHVKMEMELRGYTAKSMDYIYSYAKKIIEHSAAMHGCTSSIRWMGKTVCSNCITKEFEDQLIRLGRRLGFSVEDYRRKDVCGSDDYSTLCDRVREHGGRTAHFTCLTDMPAPLHSSRFDLQEKDILNAVKFEAAIALHLNGK